MCAGVWVAVCVDNFNDGAAAAACRQLGYCDVAASGYRNATKWVSIREVGVLYLSSQLIRLYIYCMVIETLYYELDGCRYNYISKRKWNTFSIKIKGVGMSKPKKDVNKVETVLT